MADKDDTIGPQLPPHLLKRDRSTTEIQEDKKGYAEKRSPMSLKEGKIKSGAVHHHATLKATRVEQDVFGPALPPGFTACSNDTADLSVGPALPPGWNREEDLDVKEDDDCVIGPLPRSSSASDEDLQLHIDIEARARSMKDKMHGKITSAPKRESWMTELPPELGANIGIVARAFKKRTLNATESDRSVWTDTPADREKKSQRMVKEKKGDDESEIIERQRDLEMRKRVEEHNRQYRSSSLLDMHQEERKKKKGEIPTERRPFDRNIDMDHKKVDKKAASVFIKSAKGMDDQPSPDLRENVYCNNLGSVVKQKVRVIGQPSSFNLKH